MGGVFLPLLLVALAGCGSLRRPGENAEASWYPEQLLTLEERQQEAVIKLTRVQEFLRRESLSGVLIGTVRNVGYRFVSLKTAEDSRRGQVRGGGEAAAQQPGAGGELAAAANHATGRVRVPGSSREGFNCSKRRALLGGGDFAALYLEDALED